MLIVLQDTPAKGNFLSLKPRGTAYLFGFIIYTAINLHSTGMDTKNYTGGKGCKYTGTSSTGR
jgi:hypothetical protein